LKSRIMLSNPFISVIVPAYNEENKISRALVEISSYFANKKMSYEIIVVDDGSQDTTPKIVKDFEKDDPNVRFIANDSNRGKGYSVKKGCIFSSGDLILFTDADLSTPISELETLLLWIQHGYDIAIGSRALRDSEIARHQPGYRELMGKTFNLIVQALLLPGFKDTQCGFKLFKKSVMAYVVKRQTLDGFCFDVELLSLAKRAGFRIKEVPIKWYNNPQSKVSPIQDSLRMFRDIFRIRLNTIRER